MILLQDVTIKCGGFKSLYWYIITRVDTTHWEKKSGQTVQEMARRNRQVLVDACLDRTYKGQKILEKTCSGVTTADMMMMMMNYKSEIILAILFYTFIPNTKIMTEVSFYN